MNFAVTVLLVALVQYSTAESTNLPSTTGGVVESSATTTVVPSVTTKVPESITPTELPLSSSSNPTSTAEELPAISTERTPDSTTAASTNNDISSPIPSSSTDSVPNTAVTKNTTPTSSPTSTTPEEQDEPGTLEIVYHLIRHGINFECFEKINGDEVGRKVQDGLNVCLQSGKNFGDELKRQEMERHIAAIREIEESTFGLSTMLQMAAENMRHARILAGILVQANIEGVKNTVACVSKTLSDAHQNLGVNADSVRKCLVQ